MMRKRGLLASAAVAAFVALAGSVQIVIAANGSRTITLYNIHTKETVSVLYKKDGRYIDTALQQINNLMRDHRRNESTRMDPELVDLIWEMHQEVGSKEPIHIISGYRSRATNDMLRRSVGGQASESRHILGKAADVHFPDVPVKNLRYSALVRERGGVGYYPTSALPFVHIDTDRVRSWPRLPRLELALLFPSGATKHAPADGGPLTKDDVRIAQQRHPELAAQIAEWRHPGRAPAAIAKVLPPTPPRQEVTLLSPPTEVTRANAKPPAPQKPLPAAADPISDLLSRDRNFIQASAPQLVSPPVEVRRPRPALPSLSGGPPTPETPPAPPAAKPAPKLAAIDPAERGGKPIASDTGRFGWSPIAGWSAAPAYDDEHPEELSYRTFPIAPFLTQTASEPLMHELQPHDVARTVDFIDQPSSIAPLRFRVDAQTARRLWAQFTGEAVGIEKLRDAQAGRPSAPSGIQNRNVRTTEKK